jgi:hypothetical protein
MRALLPLTFISLLTACSNTQLNVVDSLTVSAQNDGVGMHPTKWFIQGHPLQTTYVSLNGQLGLRVGQVCVASGYRSPFTSNCLNTLGYLAATNQDSNLEYKGRIYQEYYSSKSDETPQSKTIVDLLKAINEEKKLSLKYVTSNTHFLTCLTKHPIQDVKNITSDEKREALSACSTERETKEKALLALQEASLKVEALAIAPNQIVYNWAENHELKSGVVVQSESNSATVNSNKKASGYTVIKGLIIERYQMSCSELGLLQKRPDAGRLKIVTMTLAAEELYYNANEEASLSLNAAFSFTPDELKMLSKLLEKDGKALKLDIQASINASRTIASKGYLTKPEITLNNYKDITIPETFEAKKMTRSIKPSLTYYAVLSDVDTLACN